MGYGGDPGSARKGADASISHRFASTRLVHPCTIPSCSTLQHRISSLDRSLTITQSLLHEHVRTGSSRGFATSPIRASYEDTIKNLLISGSPPLAPSAPANGALADKDTRVLVQGFTGKTVSRLGGRAGGEGKC